LLFARTQNPQQATQRRRQQFDSSLQFSQP
jgi:hypothetical protein